MKSLGACLPLGVVLTVLSGGPASAVDPSTFCAERDAVVVYGNGVWDDRVGQKLSLSRVEDVLRDALSTEEFQRLEFKLASNTTNGRIADLLESAVQDLATDATSFWRFLAWLEPMPDSLQQKLEELAASIDEVALLNSQDLRNHLNMYSTSILEGRKVLLVAHSQGNFFGNQAFGNLTAAERESFGIVAVANPDSIVAGGGPHTTLVEDLVILAVRLAKQLAGLPEPQIPNATNLGTLDDLSGHTFRKAYMPADSSSLAKITGDVLDTLDGLTQPGEDAEEGIITVTLTWGAQPDVDLHAFEPNGSHVYYANRFGLSGFLDVDDVTGFGPEHYFVDCDTVETETYSVGVNYFSGSAPEIANVQVEAGLTVRSFSVFLPTAFGSAGNNSPTPVANIIVTGSPEEGFVFQVE